MSRWKCQDCDTYVSTVSNEQPRVSGCPTCGGELLTEDMRLMDSVVTFTHWPTAIHAALDLAPKPKTLCEVFAAVEAKDDPVCGECGRAKSDHRDEICPLVYFPSREYVFDAIPQSPVLTHWIEARLPSLHAALVSAWQREHGHTVEQEEPPA